MNTVLEFYCSSKFLIEKVKGHIYIYVWVFLESDLSILRQNVASKGKVMSLAVD